ncbi:hypothetical protein AA958_02640 [Streptomyces sp. CNQ-509]|uniref:hypothetical protein n=1 Tax=unclassified Streptomyces TaxID=2593676 RepID=UPI00062DD472|nr:hypothetical protein [Streptomyces sp. CNQ-509]AKH81252.1 hypothetical protein AA958_02640 [Streptomyces sp. CNQ-509]
MGHDGSVTVTDVYHYVHARLRALPQQPLMKTDGRAGQVWLARRPLRREPGSAGTDGTPRPVDVIGLPAEEQWVAVRTPQGVLRPRGRAR